MTRQPVQTVLRMAVLWVSLLGLLAPFFANSRPLWYYGIDHARYREAYVTLLTLLESPPQGGLEPAVSMQGALMAAELPVDASDQLTRMLDSEAPVASVRLTLRQRFDPERVALAPHHHFPVLGSLTVLDRLLGATALLGTALFLLQRRAVAARLPRAVRAAAGFLVAAVLALYVARADGRPDFTDYRAALGTSSAGCATSAFSYEHILWSPIAYRYDDIDLSALLSPPSLYSVPSHAPPTHHLLGTDGLGRDLLARLVWGGRVTLLVGLLGVWSALCIAVPVGLAAGYLRGRVDLVLSRVLELFECLPGMLLVLTLSALFEPGLVTIIIAIGVTSWPSLARLVRAETLRMRELHFVRAAEILGYSPWRIALRHLLPNMAHALLVTATFGVANAMLLESAVSFLGFGVSIPIPSWGGMLASARTSLGSAPWLSMGPGVALLATVVFVYGLAEDARARLGAGRGRGSETNP